MFGARPSHVDPPRARPARRPRGSRRRLLGRPHAARGRNFPDHRHADLDLSRPDRGAGLDQAGRGAGQPRARPARRQRSADAIVAACEEIRAGALHDQFVVDVIQGGAGTSTNMNANEVIANRALELLGHAQGRLPAPASRTTTSTCARAPTTSIRRRSSSRAYVGICSLVDAMAVPARAPSRPRRTNSTTSSRWAARSCRTPCR